jgi:hypothetical protein
MSSQTFRRAAATTALTIVVVALAWLVVRVTGSGPLSPTTRLPALEYRDARGSHVIRADGAEPTLIVLFDSKCGHCSYQLSALDRRSAELSRARVYFLTTETVLPAEELRRRWPSLARSPSVAWGTVNARDFRSQLRTLLTPAIFVFDARGRLLVQYIGETKLDVVLPALSGTAG